MRPKHIFEILCTLLVLTRAAGAIELTGVLVLPLTLEGGRMGPIWHTASGDEGRPLGVSLAAPAAVRTMPVANADNGEIDVGLTPGLNIVSLLWQYLANEFPPAMMVNLYFNGDNLTPGISAIVGSGPGFTQFLVNASPSTLSLYLRDVENRPGLSFDDGTFNTTLSAALYFPSNGLTRQLRPQALTNLDRVGPDSLEPDGRPDGVMILEITVRPTTLAPRAPLPRAVPRAAAPAVMPAAPRVGEDLWVPPTPPDGAAPSGAQTPTAADTVVEGTASPTMPPSVAVPSRLPGAPTAGTSPTAPPQPTSGTPTVSASHRETASTPALTPGERAAATPTARRSNVGRK